MANAEYRQPVEYGFKRASEAAAISKEAVKPIASSLTDIFVLALIRRVQNKRGGALISEILSSRFEEAQKREKRVLPGTRSLMEPV